MAYDIDVIKEQIEQKHKKMLAYINAIKNPNVDPEHKKQYEQWLGDELCCSITSSSDLNKATEDIGPVYKYQYGDCYFDYKGVRFTVADLRSMRESERTHNHTFFDIAVVIVDRYTDGIWTYDILPTYCYGSTTDEFAEFKPVHDFILEAADEYLKTHPDAVKDRQEYIKEFESEEHPNETA